MFTNPPDASQNEMKHSFKLTTSLIKVLLILLAIATLTPMAVIYGISYAIDVTYSQKRMAGCDGRTRQIAIALQMYHNTYQAFPPAFTVDADGKPLHSWRTLLLPHLDEKALYDSIDLSKPWDDPANAHAREEQTYPYHCPAITLDLRLQCYTTYLASTGPTAAFHGSKSRTRSDIQDDPAKTLMVIEVPRDHAVHWMSPQDADESMILSIGRESQLGHSRAGSIAAMFADGNAKFLKATMSAKKRKAMISIAGGD